jgi:hypothetical protein
VVLDVMSIEEELYMLLYTYFIDVRCASFTDAVNSQNEGIALVDIALVATCDCYVARSHM